MKKLREYAREGRTVIILRPLQVHHELISRAPVLHYGENTSRTLRSSEQFISLPDAYLKNFREPRSSMLMDRELTQRLFIQRKKKWLSGENPRTSQPAQQKRAHQAYANIERQAREQDSAATQTNMTTRVDRVQQWTEIQICEKTVS